jgi:amino acid efflux transporter
VALRRLPRARQPVGVGERRDLGVVRGSALYVGALIGPGLLLVPALAVEAAGAASIVAWAILLVLSAPLAITFAALAVRHPVAGGVSAYVRAGLGERAAAVTGCWFLGAVVIGAPAVSLIGGFYVADLVGAGAATAAVVGLAMFAVVVGANAFGLRVSSGVQLVLSSVLVAVLVVAIAVALPERGGDNWTPFAPHGWWAVGSAASLLVWLFVGWEAVAQLAGDFRRPTVDLPRAMGVAFGVVTVVYVGLAVATIGVSGAEGSRVPLADLIGVGLGGAGRDATALLAVALTMGTMNVYIGGAAKLAASLAGEGVLPRWPAEGAPRSVPIRPLALLAAAGAVVLGGLVAGAGSAEELVRATSALFIAVYVLAIASAVRILEGRARAAAVAALALVVALAVFSGGYLAVPAVVAVLALLVARSARPDPASCEHARPLYVRHGEDGRHVPARLAGRS